MSSLTDATAPVASRVLPITLIALRIALAAFFAFLAVKNLAGDAKIAQDFERFGYPDWFRIVVATLQIVGASLLFVPGFVVVGGAVLAVVLGGAIVSHVRHDPLASAISPAVFLVLVAVVIVLSLTTSSPAR